MGGKLLATAAAFRTVKKDVMETTSGTSYNSLGTINTGKYRVQGIELSLTGKLTETLTAQAGFALMKAKILKSQTATNVGESLSNFPERTANLQLSYQPTPKFNVGGAVRYSSEKYSGSPEGIAATSIKVPDYTVFDLFASYKLTEQLNARLNIGNVTDEKYIASLYEIGFYGAPRNYTLGVDYKF